MTKHTCPQCGFTYDDLTGEITDKPQAAPVFKELDKARGYRVTVKRGAEAASILRMLRKYTPEQLMDTWKKLKSDKFYQGKELYMMTVEGQIGAMLEPKSEYGSDKFKNQKYGHVVQR